MDTEKTDEEKRKRALHKKSFRFDQLWKEMQAQVGQKKILDGYKSTFKNLIVN